MLQDELDRAKSALAHGQAINRDARGKEIGEFAPLILTVSESLQK